jgi:hypothetical protein
MATTLRPVRTEYLAHIKKQATSGISVKKYCEQNGISINKFSYYKPDGFSSKKKSQERVKFAKVSLKKSTKVLSATCPKTSSNIDPKWLAAFLRELLEGR